MDAALGPVVAIDGRGRSARRTSPSCSSTRAGRSARWRFPAGCAVEPSRTEAELFGPEGTLTVDARAGVPADAFATLRAEFAAVARSGAPHECDVHRGLHVQRLVQMAERALARRDAQRPTPQGVGRSMRRRRPSG